MPPIWSSSLAEQVETMSEIPVHSRVALKDGADSVYLFALAGTEGWVRDHKLDEHGYELVKIEWDKDHWRYNGQSDGWTYKNHFKIIGPPNFPKEQTEAIEESELEATLADELESIGDIDLESSPSDDQLAVYVDTLTEATEAASESEAFLMIAVRRVPNPENPRETMFIPQIFTTSTSKEGALLLDIQLAECASTSYEEMVLNLIDQLRKRNDGN